MREKWSPSLYDFFESTIISVFYRQRLWSQSLALKNSEHKTFVHVYYSTRCMCVQYVQTTTACWYGGLFPVTQVKNASLTVVIAVCSLQPLAQVMLVLWGRLGSFLPYKELKGRKHAILLQSSLCLHWFTMWIICSHTDTHMLYGNSLRRSDVFDYILSQNTKWDLAGLLMNLLVPVNKCTLVHLKPLNELQNHSLPKVQKMSLDGCVLPYRANTTW